MLGENTTRASVAEDSPYAFHPDPQAAQLKAALLKEIRRSVYVYRVDCGGCNGCEIEIFAALTPLFDVERFGIKVVSSPRHADVLIYTGAMTRSMRVPALRAYQAAPDPKICVAYGACGCSGGIFHDLYCVWGGADKLIPIDVYIPGCPPTPVATIYGHTQPEAESHLSHAGGRRARPAATPRDPARAAREYRTGGTPHGRLLAWTADRRNIYGSAER
jgi:Ni,Fe-hydrogenase III small subunit